MGTTSTRNFSVSTPTVLCRYVCWDPFTKFLDLVKQAITDPHILHTCPYSLPHFSSRTFSCSLISPISSNWKTWLWRVRFVWEVALSGSEDTIRITQGKVAEQYLESPNYLIGGPGKVIVDLDSVALFERADGTPHVIDPRAKNLVAKLRLMALNVSVRQLTFAIIM